MSAIMSIYFPMNRYIGILKMVGEGGKFVIKDCFTAIQKPMNIFQVMHHLMTSHLFIDENCPESPTRWPPPPPHHFSTLILHFELSLYVWIGFCGQKI